jgi:rhodanese-related sulfurtransferase
MAWYTQARRILDMASFHRIDPAGLKERLESKGPPLVLDARRRAAFAKLPQGIPGAIPIVLDDQPIELPDMPREQPIVAYCL